MSGSRGCFTPGGLLIELTSDGPKHRFPSRRLVLSDVDTRGHLRCRCLAFGFQPQGLNASRFLTSGLPPLHLQVGRRLSRDFLAFGLQPRDLDASRFLTSGLPPLCLQLGRRLSRDFLAFGLQPSDLDASRFLTSGLFPPRLLRYIDGIP